ncbi:FadR family transcriptional regulator [Eoetvoesia caeni]|nr:FadR family transcriptional regulator [Eoetvoesiella caeni]
MVTLRALIQKMYAKGGRQLPPERRLAEQLGTGRSTLRKALTILENEKTVVRHVGRGTFLNSGAETAPPQLQALASSGALAIDSVSGLSPRELMEVRYVLEPATAELAAIAARPSDLKQMRECLRKREQAHRLDDYEHWDYVLHMSIAEATRNSLLTELLDLINRIRKTAAWRQFRRPSVDPDVRAISNTHHREIVDAICRADPSAAFEAMRNHLGEVSHRYQHYSDMQAPTPSVQHLITK